jgi:hypothetical protein
MLKSFVDFGRGVIYMLVLVIPDIHLKPWMFYKAADLLKQGVADKAVCLMDIADDWGKSLEMYEQTYDQAILFAQEFPDTLWCYGNHDLSYIWHEPESGYNSLATWTVTKRLERLKEVLPDEKQLAYIQRIDNVIFSHGGVADEFVRKYIPSRLYDDIDTVIETINGFGREQMWQDISPIWCRPQYERIRMYKARTLLQVVGHTPIRDIRKEKNVISCDVFSTYDDGRPVGTQEFLVIDTETWKWRKGSDPL